jgi:hypothetical protein
MYEPNETIPISSNSSTQTHTDTETWHNRIYFLYPTACSVFHRPWTIECRADPLVVGKES